MDGSYIVPAAGECHLAGLNLSAAMTSISSESSITAITSSGGGGSGRDQLMNMINALPAGMGDDDLLRLIIMLLVLELLRGNSADSARGGQQAGNSFSFLHMQQSTQVYSEQVSLQMAAASYAGEQVSALPSTSSGQQAPAALDVTG
jgi:hypothetical protein